MDLPPWVNLVHKDTEHHCEEIPLTLHMLVIEPWKHNHREKSTCRDAITVHETQQPCESVTASETLYEPRYLTSRYHSIIHCECCPKIISIAYMSCKCMKVLIEREHTRLCLWLHLSWNEQREDNESTHSVDQIVETIGSFLRIFIDIMRNIEPLGHQGMIQLTLYT